MKVEIEFVALIVGHDVETIKQMYEDWLKSPSRSKKKYSISTDILQDWQYYKR